MLVIVAAVTRHTRHMLLGDGPDGGPGGVVTLPRSLAVPLVAGLAACAVLGVTLGPLHSLLQAAAVIAGATS